MPPDSEVVCPFCGHRTPLTGDPIHPFVFEGYRDFECYRCPCGAVGSPSGDIGEAGWSLDAVEQALCRGILQAERGTCHVDINYVTQTIPPLLILWAKRRPAPPA
ncbi:MAG: hypothetical protein ABSD47_04890 [Candidatus Methylomirabilota bacterium]|jgi:hypothetical protein